MKNILPLVLLFIAAKAGAQCPEYVNTTTPKAYSLIKAAESYLHSGLAIDTTNAKTAVYEDGDDIFLYRVDVDKAGSVKHINISGPADKMEAFYNAEVKPKITGCITKQAGSWLYFNQTMLVYTANNGKKSLDIEFKPSF